MNGWIHRAGVVVFATGFTLAAPSHAQDNPPAIAEATEVGEARAHFRAGTDLVVRSEWAQALDEFERSYELVAHPVTRYNIGVAERALGKYTRARSAFMASLNDTQAGTALPAVLADQARAFIEESDGIIGRLTLDITPEGATVVADGRPLQALSVDESDADTTPRFVAGTRKPGRGEALAGRRFRVELDPGAHVIVFQRKGYADVVLNRSIKPGASERQTISLDKLPANIRVQSGVEKARVTIDGADVGFAPVDVPRPPGTYLVEVSKDGRVPFSARVTLAAGGESNLRAPLPEREMVIWEQWWFWSAAGVALTGVAVGTYFAVRPEPERPAVNGGTLGWAIDLR